IAGYMFPIESGFRTRAFFLPFPTSWGWGTWQHAWRHFDPGMTGYAALQRSPQLRRKFDLEGAYDYSGLLDRQAIGTVDSWAIRWYLSCFMRQGVTLFPGTTLINNHGLDGSGTHGGDECAPHLPPLPDSEHAFVFPKETVVDLAAYAQVQEALRKKRRPTGLMDRLRRRWV